MSEARSIGEMRISQPIGMKQIMETMQTAEYEDLVLNKGEKLNMQYQL